MAAIIGVAADGKDSLSCRRFSCDGQAAAGPEPAAGRGSPWLHLPPLPAPLKSQPRPGNHLIGWYLAAAGITSVHGAAGSIMIVLLLVRRRDSDAVHVTRKGHA